MLSKLTPTTSCLNTSATSSTKCSSLTMMSLTPLLWDTTSYLALLKLLLTWVLYNPHNGRAVFPNILATSYNVVELQEKFDELEQCRVFWHPEDVGVTVEYFNPSFLVKKPSGRFCLVMAFTDVGQYSRPQPLLMPDVILLFAPSSHESTSLSLTSPAIFTRYHYQRLPWSTCTVASPPRFVASECTPYQPWGCPVLRMC